MSTEFKQMPDAVQGHHETFHDMRQPVPSVLALAAAVSAEPDLACPANVALNATRTDGPSGPVTVFAVNKTIVKHGGRLDCSGGGSWVAG